jgi:type IV pilus assembly protein PilA
VLTRIRKATESKDQGFTLIELLVVMIIIGILAAIAIPTFLNQKNKAKATSVKSDAATIGKEIAAYYVDGGATSTIFASSTGTTWALGTTANGTDIATGRLSEGNSVHASSITGDNAFCVVVVNAQAGTANAWRFNQVGLSRTAAC